MTSSIALILHTALAMSSCLDLSTLLWSTHQENDEPAQPNAEVPKISFKSPAELRVPFLQV